MYDKKEPDNPDTALIKNAGSVITKCVLGIAFCITAGIIFSTCGVSENDIQECKSACGSRGMVSASMWTCQCGWSSSSNNYVIPRNTSKSANK